jgi:hypothetical protein
MTKHTPGPWHVHPDHPRAIDADGVEVALAQLVIRPGGCDIQMVTEAEANAVLIAAAPAMLAALRALLAVCEEELDAGRVPEMIEARAAIAKAEGRA